MEWATTDILQWNESITGRPDIVLRMIPNQPDLPPLAAALSYSLHYSFGHATWYNTMISRVVRSYEESTIPSDHIHPMSFMMQSIAIKLRTRIFIYEANGRLLNEFAPPPEDNTWFGRIALASASGWNKFAALKFTTRGCEAA